MLRSLGARSLGAIRCYKVLVGSPELRLTHTIFDLIVCAYVLFVLFKVNSVTPTANTALA